VNTFAKIVILISLIFGFVWLGGFGEPTRGLETFGRHVYVGAAWIATHLLFLIGLGMVLWSARFLGEFGWRMPERRFRVLGIVFVLFAVILMLTVWDSK